MATTGAAPPEPCKARPVCAVSCAFGRGSTPFSSVVAMKNAARLFTCASCRRQVVLCRRCDHGNIYCSRHCSGRARRRSVRLAGQRYQDSRRGCHKHAERQRRYRERRRCPAPAVRASVQKVTHHPLTRERRRPFVRKTQDGRSGTQPSGQKKPTGVLRCHGCGRFCRRAAIRTREKEPCLRSRLPKRGSGC